jgi:hypothetical protein
VPFDFLRRKKEPEPEDRAPSIQESRTAMAPSAGRGVGFDGLTEEWRLVGRMEITGRLSDALNRREAIPLSDVRWAPIDGSAGFSEVPGLKSVDPYDLIMVLAGEESQPPLTEAERVAHKVHKVAYEVSLEAPPFRIDGTVFLFPGSDPERLLERANEMFLPVVDAAAFLGDRQLSDPGIEAILVNRFYLRGVTQVDKPGDPRSSASLGGPAPTEPTG